MRRDYRWGPLIPGGLDCLELPTLSMRFVGDDIGRPLINIVDRVADSALGNENIVISREPEPAREPWGCFGRRCLGDVVVEVDNFLGFRGGSTREMGSGS